MAEQKEAIEKAVNIIKNSIERRVAESTERLIKAEIEQTLKEEFLETLSHKVEQIGQAKVVGRDFSDYFINFGCEIPKIDPADTQIPRKLIRTIDDVNLEYFFKKPTKLHIFNFCSKYFMFSQFCNTRQVNLINFNWSKNKFDEKQICYCFVCKFNLELAEDQEKKAVEQNDN